MASTLDVINAAQLAVLANKPAATLYQTTGQNITNTTNTFLTWNSVAGDSWNAWSSGSPTRYTVPVAGWYKIDATVMWPSNSTGARHVELYYNTTEEINTLSVWTTAPASVFPQTSNTAILYGNVGDYFQVNLWQSSGVTLTLNPAAVMVVEFIHF